MKVIFNYSGLKGSTVPAIDDVNSNIDSAIRECNSMYVPSDFRYAIYLRELKSELSRHKRDLTNIKSWLEKTNSRLNNSVTDTEMAVKRIKEINIKKRNNSVSRVA